MKDIRQLVRDLARHCEKTYDCGITSDDNSISLCTDEEIFNITVTKELKTEV